jgi:hypothetical protein
MVLGAIFRYALESAEYWRNGPLVALLVPGLEETSDEDTSTRRRAALSQFFRAMAGMNLSPGMIKLRDIFLKFDNAFLTPVDKQAIESLRS